MKKCPKCGKENIDEARFCTWCRAELPVISEKKKNDLGRIIAIVILISVICACLAGVFMLFKDKQNRDTRFEKWILKISPLTFGVYLIHMNANLAKIYWGQLKYSLDANSYGIFLWYIVSTVIVFGISTIIDQIRNIGVKQIKNIFMRK